MEKPIAILFVDIADSTRLYETLGNVQAAALTRKMLFHLRLVIEVNGGAVIKTLGDGLLGALPTADDAGWAAGTMIASSPLFGLKLRVGLNYGPVVQRVEDVYGDACNVAARVEALAKPGEILATEAFALRLSPRLRLRTRALSHVSVKGKTDPIRIHAFLPTDQEADSTMDSTAAGFLAPPPQGGLFTLRLTLGGSEFSVNRFFPRLTVGRDGGADMRVPSRQASRQHAVIDFSRESFILTDQSTNGTFIRSGGSHAVALRRDSTKLVGAGLIGFGAEPMDETEDHVAAFRCERLG